VTQSDVPRPSALVVISGDDVYEDLFTAGVKLQEILAGCGFAAATAMGTGCLAAGGGAVADLIVLYTAVGEFPAGRQAALAGTVLAGAGLLALHASNVFPGAGWEVLRALVGSRYVSHGPEPHESRFLVETDPRHPLTRGLDAFEITHEHYELDLAGDADVVAWRRTAADREPVAYTRRAGRGRVCYVQLGHDMRAWDDPPARELVTRCARWACRPESRHRRPQRQEHGGPR